MNFEQIVATRGNKTVYRDGGKCIKLFNEGYSKADILNEALNQARIEETGISIPSILEITTVEGRWALISEYIEGKSLAQMISDSPERKAEYLALLAELQLKIHGEKCPLLNRTKDKLDRKLADTDFDATTRYDLHNRLEAMPRGNSICHGDFSPSNIIIGVDGTPFILDWSHATQGNSQADAAKSYILFKLDGDAEGAETYINIFCEKSGIARADIFKWIPIVAAALTTERDDGDLHLLESLVNGEF